MPSNDFDPSFTDRYLGLPLFSNYFQCYDDLYNYIQVEVKDEVTGFEESFLFIKGTEVS